LHAPKVEAVKIIEDRRLSKLETSSDEAPEMKSAYSQRRIEAPGQRDDAGQRL
jgi:hypothetical protein